MSLENEKKNKSCKRASQNCKSHTQKVSGAKQWVKLYLTLIMQFLQALSTVHFIIVGIALYCETSLEKELATHFERPFPILLMGVHLFKQNSLRKRVSKQTIVFFLLLIL